MNQRSLEILRNNMKNGYPTLDDSMIVVFQDSTFYDLALDKDLEEIHSLAGRNPNERFIVVDMKERKVYGVSIEELKEIQKQIKATKG